MAQNPDISKYFNEDQSNESNQFFDKVNTDQPAVPSTVEKNEDTVGSSDKDEEPVVCKIFQSSSTKKTFEADPSNFFDMIGTVDNELNATYQEQDLNASSNPTGKDSGDILSFFKTFDENFSKPTQVTESERSRDAWIIPDSARKILSTPPGSCVTTRDMLTMPGVILEEELKDTIYEAVHHLLGENEASKRKILTAAEVTEDDRGIRDLIRAGCYKAAVNLTKTLLTTYGQGPGKAGHPSKHTVRSIQLWFTRLALLVKLKSFSLAYDESEPFGDLEKPDMFFQFYPKLYEGRTGSIVPFSLRLLVAQMPAYIDKHQLALTRLHAVLATVRKILANLEKGFFEDGTPSEIGPEAKAESIKLWKCRETRVLHAIVSCSLAFKDYSLAIEVVQMLIDREQDQQQQRCLQSALGRILLQLGDIVSAEKQFSLARNGLAATGTRDLIDSGLSLLAQNQFQEAYKVFEKAYELDPRNITAINNIAVCLLYLGRLKQAIVLLEDTIQKYPKTALHESLLLNLCTLYELQSSYYSQAKLKLLKLVNQNKGDGFNIGCLKLHM
ncbi:UNVERIFIED_CONTAM: hypothetical protein PYX00_001094 [Menopon gallinae]|uniref:Trafficking protein particle complex subunit 12 n=1 Tax=Menopon gallinae TaxID=328185 RepID=A0AAW2IBM0_9NEOP